MEMIWNNIQSDWVNIGLAIIILLFGLKSLLYWRDWTKQKQKFLAEFNMAPEEVDKLFQPASDRVYKLLSFIFSLSAVLGSFSYIYLNAFGERSLFQKEASIIYLFSVIFFLVFGGALLAFKNQTMRAVMRLGNLDYFRPGSNWRKRLIGDPLAKHPFVHGYARFRGFIWFAVGLFLAYQLLRNAIPGLPAIQ